MSLPSSPPVSDFATDPAASRLPPLPDPATGVPPLPDLSPDAPSGAPATQPVSPDTPLTLRQEAFCRHFAATGNAAGAAREAGYAEGSARQTGHELLERPAVAARVRDIRQAWRAVEREEAQILLGRLEQAWDVAVEKGSATLMLRVVKLQAELSGLDRRHAGRRAGLWPLPGEEALPRPADAAAPQPGPLESPPTGPLAEAVRRGRHRTERALALHRASRKALERRPDFDEADWLATAHRLHGTVEERRLAAPGPAPAGGDSGAETPAADAPTLTEHDISLHRAGLLPAETEGDDWEDGEPGADRTPYFFDRIGDRPAHAGRDNRKYTDKELKEFRAAVRREVAEARLRHDAPDERRKARTPGGGVFPQPAGDSAPGERRAAEEEQDYLKDLARTRPQMPAVTAGAYLSGYSYRRPCRGEQRTMTEHDNS